MKVELPGGNMIFHRGCPTVFMRIMHSTRLLFLTAALAGAATSTRALTPPAGFIALFNGQDLAGWRGGDTFDHRKLLDLPPDQRAAKIEAWNNTMLPHCLAD